MRILTPVCNLRELQRLSDHGVDEVYCGVLSRRWAESYSSLASINRVDRLNGNLRDYDELRGLVKYAHSCNIRVNLALNGLYTREQEPVLQEELDTIAGTGIDGLIVADIGLLATIKKRKMSVKIHASTGMTVFNSQSVALLKEQGVSRIVLPRSLRVEDIRMVVQNNSDVEFEVFIMNGRCKNVDGFCTFHHGLSDLKTPALTKFLVSSRVGELAQEALVRLPSSLRRKAMACGGSSVCSTACSLDYDMHVRQDEKPPVNFKSSSGVDFLDDMFSCGGCAIQELSRSGVGYVKIVGRTFPLERKIRDVRYLRRLINAAQKGILSIPEFRDYAKGAYQEIYGMSCRRNCYYP